MPATPILPSPATPSRFARIGVVAKPGLDSIGAEASALVRWLAARGVDTILEARTADQAGLALPGQPTRGELPRLVDLIVVLGGDGTMLGVAGNVAQAKLETPILGVNYGTLGFLTEVPLPQLYIALEATLDGRCAIETRAMLSTCVVRGGAPQSEHIVVNDVALTGGSLSRIVEFSVSVDGEFVAAFNADGIILSSPTGSTAYNLSAGGPIVHPKVDAVILTPIAPHTLTNRPIVIPATAHVIVRPALNRPRDVAHVTYDGQQGDALESGDEVHVTRSAQSMHLVRPAPRSYYAVLREKLRWTAR
jgi:NAD+ kinase